MNVARLDTVVYLILKDDRPWDNIAYGNLADAIKSLSPHLHPTPTFRWDGREPRESWSVHSDGQQLTEFRIRAFRLQW